MIEPLLEAERAMTVGMLDHAERIYRGVAETDPRNSIAVVGLARVALERGHDVEALQLARRALLIDGENVAARRLVARLEEVLAMRGVPLPPEETAEPLPAPSAAAASPPSAPTTPSPTPPPTAPSPAAPSPTPVPARTDPPARRGLIARLLRRE